jgi:putative N6-adenine-specific DNA methylase
MPSDTDLHPCFATCARGLEPILAQELRALHAAEVAVARGGVAFRGDQRTLYRANLWLRTAIRVLRHLHVGTVDSPEALYHWVQALDWPALMSADQTLAVDCNVRDSALTHSHYAALKTKDAICDQFVARCGRRPSVDTERPMVKLNLHIEKNQATLSLDSSGDSLHKRGYRPAQVRAPLNEALAAGLVMLTGWDRETPLIDPLCGSGTFLIEAAWLALRRPPGLTRKHFGFMGWHDFDIRLWTELRDEARATMLSRVAAPLLGGDRRGDALAMAERNARAAGVGHLLRWRRGDVADFVPPPAARPGVLICNPPYGIRLGEEKEAREVHRRLGELLHTRCRGYSAWIFTAHRGAARDLGLKPTQRLAFFNGQIPCELLTFQVAP